jgi:hypothetical protein
MPADFVETSEGLMLIADGINPVKRWDGFAGTLERAGVTPPSLAPVLTQAAGGGAITGEYVAYFAWVDRTGIESSLSPVSDVVELTNALQVEYTLSDVPQNGEPVELVRIYRNTAGQLRTVYLDIESQIVGPASFISTREDASLATRPARPLVDGRNRDQTRVDDPPPDIKPLIAEHNGVVYLAGSEPYAEGSVAVTAGSQTVTGTGTEWKENFTGRFLYVDGADRSYEIDFVDEEAQTLTLVDTGGYGGDTDKYAAYSIRPAPAEENIVYFCLAGRPQSWPAVNGISLPEVGGTLAGLRQVGSFIYMFKRGRSFRFTVQSNPATDGFVFPAADRGLINQRCAVVVGDMAYCLDERGVYAFDGDQARSVSDRIQDIFRRRGDVQINWAASRFFHGVNSPQEDTARWFVCLRGDYLPRHALAYHYVLDRWSIEEWPFPVGASCLGWGGRATGGYRPLTEQVYLGGPAGRVYALQESAGDGIAAPASVELAAVAPMAVTLAHAAVAAAATPGFSLAVATGRGRGQVRTVCAVDGAELLLDRPWLVTPEAGDRVVVGGIPYRFRTHEFPFAPTEAAGERSVRIDFERVPGETMDLRFRTDTDETWREAAADLAAADHNGVKEVKGRAEREIDLGVRPPVARLRMDGHREGFTPGEESLQLELSGVSGATPHAVTGLTVKGAG